MTVENPVECVVTVVDEDGSVTGIKSGCSSRQKTVVNQTNSILTAVPLMQYAGIKPLMGQKNWGPWKRQIRGTTIKRKLCLASAM